MFGEEQLELMKPNAIVLNTARGKVLDEKALARAIDEGRIRGAAIDAFEEEPLPMDSPLRKLGDQVLLSPHSAVLHRRRRAAAGRGLGHALGGHRAQGWHSRQCLQPGSHSALEGALWRGQRRPVPSGPLATHLDSDDLALGRTGWSAGIV